MAKKKSKKRIDGRKLDEMREMEARSNLIDRANGSGYFRFGKTTSISGVYGPVEMHPKHLLDPLKAFIKFRYNMVPFSTEERIRPGPNRRSREISKVVKEALSGVIELEEFPRASIEIYSEVLEADASTRCAALNAASIALANAGILMKDLIASCAAGKVNGQIVLDVAGKEDTEGEVDLPIAYVPSQNKIHLLQMDGIITKKEFKKALELAIEGCKKVHKKQKEALKKEFKGLEEGGDKE